MKEKPEDSIPEHKAGTAVDVEDSRSFSTDEDAQRFFRQVKERLLTVNSWHEYAGVFSAVFSLTDSAGQEVKRYPQQGDYFKISIPAFVIKTGEGFDWVRIEEINESVEAIDECISIRVRPASSPLNDNKDVAHFYTDDATSNFIAKRQGKTVTVGVYGRNEKPNIEAADNLLDKVRNAIVGVGGVTGFSKLHWKGLVEGLLMKK